MCKYCNTIICPKCDDVCKCYKCKETVCKSHSIQCQACFKHVCFESNCMSNIYSCRLCHYYFCEAHIQDHIKANQLCPFQINCSSPSLKLQNINIAMIEEFFKLSSHMCHLQELRISIPEFAEQGAKLYAKLLPHQPSLQYISIIRSNIADAGAKEICKALQSSNRLTLINFEGNALTDESAAYIGQLVASKQSIKEVGIGGCNSRLQ